MRQILHQRLTESHLTFGKAIDSVVPSSLFILSQLRSLFNPPNVSGMC